MTDFLPESAWIESASSGEADLHESTFPPISVPAPDRRRTAAALAGAVNEMLGSMAHKRVPRLDAARERLQQSRPGQALDPIEDALHAVHAATTAVDFLAGRTGGERGLDFLRQGDRLAQATQHLRTVAGEFMQREAVHGPITRLTWIDLVVESASLRKRVRQGAHWLAEMDRDLLQRRRGANTEVTLHAIDELARRRSSMHGRLQSVHRLCSQARAVHGMSERIVAERGTLCTTLQERVLRACQHLDDAVQPLLHAAGYRALVPTELVGAIDAVHALQVELTHAAAQIVRLHGLEQELAAQLATMADKARRVTGG